MSGADDVVSLDPNRGVEKTQTHDRRRPQRRTEMSSAVSPSTVSGTRSTRCATRQPRRSSRRSREERAPTSTEPSRRRRPRRPPGAPRLRRIAPPRCSPLPTTSISMLRSSPVSRSQTRASLAAQPPTSFHCARITSASSPVRRGVLEGRAAGEYLAGYTSAIRREPVGVVGQITPWNYRSRWRSGRSAGARRRQHDRPEAF